MRVTICWLLLALAAPLSFAADFPAFDVIPISANSTQPAPMPRAASVPATAETTPRLDPCPPPAAHQQRQVLALWRGQDFDSSDACIYGRADYLRWTFKDAAAPPLVTTGPAGVLPTLDSPGTRLLAGGELEGEEHSGARFLLGFRLPLDWLDLDWTIACEAAYFFASPHGNLFAATSAGTPVLGRPFTDLSTGVPLSVVESVANLPGVGGLPALGGTVTVENASRLHGLEFNTVCNLFSGGCGNHCDLLLGYRHVAMNEDLAIREDLLALDGSNEINLVRDTFSTRNRFNGGQVGVRSESRFGRLFLQGTAKVALGANEQSININGVTINSTAGGPPVTGTGGLLAQTSNIGRRTHEEFCVVPEAEVRMGVTVCRCMRLSAGYNFLYMSRVVRPGDQIDLGVNTNQLPSFIGGVAVPGTGGGLARPAPLFQQSDFWAHGLTASVELSW